MTIVTGEEGVRYQAREGFARHASQEEGRSRGSGMTTSDAWSREAATEPSYAPSRPQGQGPLRGEAAPKVARGAGSKEVGCC